MSFNTLGWPTWLNEWKLNYRFVHKSTVGVSWNANTMCNNIIMLTNSLVTFSNATDLCIFGNPVVVSNLEKNQILLHLYVN